MKEQKVETSIKPDIVGNIVLPAVYSEHCPYCGSENITMIGDPEYNDELECEDCKKYFNSFNIK